MSYNPYQSTMGESLKESWTKYAVIEKALDLHQQIPFTSQADAYRNIDTGWQFTAPGFHAGFDVINKVDETVDFLKDPIGNLIPNLNFGFIDKKLMGFVIIGGIATLFFLKKHDKKGELPI